MIIKLMLAEFLIMSTFFWLKIRDQRQQERLDNMLNEHLKRTLSERRAKIKLRVIR